jgi:16S rRNA (cytosine967-C5)-methyltransferase
VIIAAAAGRPMSGFQPAVLDLLRLGAHQVLSMRVPVHAAVAASVDLAAVTVGERVTGLVNAVLRRVAERSLDDWFGQLTHGLDEHDRLGLRTAHPRWIVEAYADLLQPTELEQALSANNLSPNVSLAVRPGLAEVSDLVQAGAQPIPYSPFGAFWRGDPADLQFVRDGRAGVQDEGSQLVTWALTRAAAPSGWWLDLCAGPGGKSALLAGLARPDGNRLLASDLAPHRANLVAGAVRAYMPRTAQLRPSWWPTVPDRHGGPARSPGCSSMSPALAWARCAAGRNLAGAATRPTWSSCIHCSWHCWRQPLTAPLPVGSSAT